MSYSDSPPTVSGPLPPQDDPWWEQAANWLVPQLFGGSDKVADIPTYYGGSLAGVVFCAGPFTPAQVRALLDAAPPARVAEARAVLEAADGRWKSEYPPKNNAELAGALVAEAHGGRDCTPSDWPSQSVVKAIRGLAPTSSGTFPPIDVSDITQAGSSPLAALLVASGAAWAISRVK